MAHEVPNLAMHSLIIDKVDQCCNAPALQQIASGLALYKLRTVASGQLSVVCGQFSVVSYQWSVVSGQ